MSTNKYRNETIESFLKSLSSSDSMPGGGVVSALVAANGISLILMVINLSIGREKYINYEELLLESKNKSLQLKEDFLELMDKDAENFKTMEKVFKMNNKTNEEKEQKK